MNLFTKLIRAIFLVKEIISKRGEVHFRRYRLLQTPWFAIYIHQICKSDEDRDPHSHPWSFQSVILDGSYMEDSWNQPEYFIQRRLYFAGDVIKHHTDDVHKITLVSKEVWTLVFTSGHAKYWGYRLQDGTFIGHEEYRELKNEGKLR